MVRRADPERRPASIPMNRWLYDATYGKDVGLVGSLVVSAARPTTEPSPPSRAPRAVGEALRASVVRGEPLSGSFDERLTAAVHEAVRPRRLTPAEPYIAHRAYPSPRSIFSVDATRVSGDGHVGDEAGAARVEVTPVPERIPPAYGELRVALSELEAGHMAATLALTMQRAGLRCVPVFGDEGRILLLVSDAHLGPDDGELVADLDEFSSDPSVVLGEWLDRRTSGAFTPSRSGNVRGVQAAVDFDALVGRCLADDAFASLGVAVHRHDSDDIGYGLARYRNIGAHERARTAPNDASLARSTLSAYCPRPVGYTFTVDPRSGTDTGQRPTTTLGVVGWIAQWACLAAAARGLSAYPLKNFDEARWSSALRLPLPETPVYQLWFDRPRSLTDFGHPWSTMGVRL